jgi:hypothetical protein
VADTEQLNEIHILANETIHREHPDISISIHKVGYVVKAIEELTRRMYEVKDPCPHGQSMCGDCGEKCDVRGKYL